MPAEQILKELKSLGSESYKKVMRNHGIREPFFGVKIGDLKKIQKRVKTDYRLALDLFETGNYDAMYLAGLIADDGRMTKKDLRGWMKKVYAGPLVTPVAWVASGGPHWREMALEWIESKDDLVAAAGWATLSSAVVTVADAELDLPGLKKLLQRVQKEIHKAQNEERQWMNSFVIAVGCSVKPLSEVAMGVAEKIGEVTVDMGDTSCQVPFAPDYIRKVEAKGGIGKKRKTAKC